LTGTLAWCEGGLACELVLKLLGMGNLAGNNYAKARAAPLQQLCIQTGRAVNAHQLLAMY